MSEHYGADDQTTFSTGAATAWPGSGFADPGAHPPAANRLYMTSELRAATGITRTHMDFYLREGIIQPTARTESGYLLFAASELDTLRTVLRWRQDGLGIKEIRERLGRA